jgi:guanylate kinase
MQAATPGLLYVVSAPSGGGKTSLVQALIKAEPKIRVSTSFTTRPARPGEVDGVNYHFVEKHRFEQLIAQGAFLEHACVFDHYYGTAKTTVEDLLGAGLDVILEIDWQGARQIKASFPACVSVFILPPSYAQLEQRLRNRGADDPAVVARRMRDAVNEMSHFAEYDYLVINDEFEVALADLRAILRAGRLRRPRQALTYADLIKNLLA